MKLTKAYSKSVNLKEFRNLIYEVSTDRVVQRMKLYKQHCNTSCYAHCYEASFHCYRICKMLGFDYVSAVRGAMLHDLFLYDWRVSGKENKWHAFTHGKTAYENATKIFELNEIEKDMIVNHMWPMTISFPKTKEGWVLTFVDKYCALKEIIRYYVFNFIKD